MYTLVYFYPFQTRSPEYRECLAERFCALHFPIGRQIKAPIFHTTVATTVGGPPTLHFTRHSLTTHPK